MFTKSWQLIFAILVFFCYNSNCSNVKFVKNDFISFEQPFHENTSSWNLFGSASRELEQVKLTPDEVGKSGSMWSSSVLEYKNWQFTSEIVISRSRIKEFSGSGIVYLYTAEKDLSGPISELKKLTGLAISIEFSDIKTVGLPFIRGYYTHPELTEINDLKIVHNFPLLLGECKVLSFEFNKSFLIQVRYSNKKISVEFNKDPNFAENPVWTTCFEMAELDVAEKHYWGIGASNTPFSSQSHEVKSFILDNDATELRINTGDEKNMNIVGKKSTYREDNQDAAEKVQPYDIADQAVLESFKRIVSFIDDRCQKRNAIDSIFDSVQNLSKSFIGKDHLKQLGVQTDINFRESSEFRQDIQSLKESHSSISRSKIIIAELSNDLKTISIVIQRFSANTDWLKKNQNNTLSYYVFIALFQVLFITAILLLFIKKRNKKIM